jgi:hypothetical protein
MTRELYHALGSPSVNDFKAIIQKNAIGNLPITLEDMEAADMVFGSDIGVLKRKLFELNRSCGVKFHWCTKRDNQQSTKGIETMNMKVLTFSQQFQERYSTELQNLFRIKQSYRNVSISVFRIYHKARFTININTCDNENIPIIKDVEDIYNVWTNLANPHEHVPEAERNIRVIKENCQLHIFDYYVTKYPR